MKRINLFINDKMVSEIVPTAMDIILEDKDLSNYLRRKLISR